MEKHVIDFDLEGYEPTEEQLAVLCEEAIAEIQEAFRRQREAEGMVSDHWV